jgi:hypothetical protein
MHKSGISRGAKQSGRRLTWNGDDNSISSFEAKTASHQP